jgi:hypothetical protein
MFKPSKIDKNENFLSNLEESFEKFNEFRQIETGDEIYFTFNISKFIEQSMEYTDIINNYIYNKLKRKHENDIDINGDFIQINEYIINDIKVSDTNLYIFGGTSDLIEIARQVAPDNDNLFDETDEIKKLFENSSITNTKNKKIYFKDIPLSIEHFGHIIKTTKYTKIDKVSKFHIDEKGILYYSLFIK